MASRPFPELTIDLVHDSPTERASRDLLLTLRETYPLDRWRYTDHVRISDDEIPHSHPVLTVSGHSANAHPLRLLSSYLHEQLHWFAVLEDHFDRTQDAFAVFARQHPELPIGPPDGCRSAYSNLLHLAVNYWELEGLGELIGEDDARAFIAGKPYYREIYRLVLEQTGEIAAVLEEHRLAVPEMPPVDRRFSTPVRHR